MYTIRLITFHSVIQLYIALLYAIVCGLSAEADSLLNDESKTLSAIDIDTPVKLDGIMDEPSWNGAEIATDFIQRELEEGAPATEKTEVKILYDKHCIYIGIMCFDTEPEKIVHTEMRRDGALWSDDNFTVVLDTFNDKRSGFFFRINPNGARLDGKFTGSRRWINDDWNGIWDVSAKITDRGWSAEMLIPFKTLRFPPGEEQLWGINFRREIARKNEEVLWCSWRRDDGIMQLSKAGTLTGLRNIQRGKQIEFKPFTLGGLENEDNDFSKNFKYGLDVKYPLTSDLTLDLTTLTDFAQIESDRNRINLTRFSLYYPEKRDFFLEGAETFDFGSRFTSPYYSRRIGINPDEEQVPILGGAKLTGKAGSYNLGILNMQTDKKDGYASTNYSVIRVKRDILERSYIGFIATNLYDSDKHENRAFGADFSFNTNTFLSNKNLEIGGYIADNQATGVKHGTRAGRFLVRYPNDIVSMYLLYHVVGENYEPETGYVRRNGIKQYSVDLDYSPRPSLPYIRQLRFTPLDINYYTDMNNRLLTRSLQFTPLGINTTTGEYFRFRVEQNYEYLDEEFEIFEDDDGPVIITQDTYTWWTYTTSFESSSSRPLSFDFDYEWGDFFNGQRKNFGIGFNVKMNEHITISPDMEYNNISLGSRNFDTKEFGGRINMNVSPRLTSRTFLQWNNETKEFNMNFLIHFIPQIGSDIFFVYNHLWDGNQDYRTINNTGMAKVAYLVRY